MGAHRPEVITKDGQDHILQSHLPSITYLDLNDQDVIYGSSFKMMIKEAFRQDKHFILARTQSRGLDKFDDTFSKEESTYLCKPSDLEEAEGILAQESEVVYNYFNVFSILKLIIQKKPDGSYVGRFDPDSGITVTNPLTNARIIGEVEFYLVENPYL